jgi:outer membrane receptor protein involved in Fe transport
MNKQQNIASILSVFLILTGSLFAQRSSIEGVIVDSESGEKIPFATVALWVDGIDSPQTGATSNDEGIFKLEKLNAGRYQVSISFMGFNTLEISDIVIESARQHISLGTVTLSPTHVMVDEVQVTAMARTESSHLDRRTYRAGDFETARGGTAVDVLNRLPSVAVSPDGEVSVRGTTDFVVYLNGRPTQMEPSVLLGQLSANSIESIDLITVPSARYDAQGKGGIINITTRTSGIEGFSFSANGLIGAAPWGNVTDKISGYNLKDDRYGGGLNIAYAKNNLILYGGMNYSWRDVNSSRTGDARILNNNNGTYKHMVASGMKPEWYENFTTNLGLEFNLSKKSQLTASYYHGTRTEGRQALYLYNLFMADRDKNPVDGVPTNEQWLFNPNEGIRKGIFHTVNTDYNLQISDQSDLKLSLLYEHSRLTHDIDNPNIHYNPENGQLENKELHYIQRDNTPLDGFRFSADYSTELKNGHVFSMGIQPQLFKIDGGFKYDTLNVETDSWGSITELENQIELKRDIYAAYADLSGAFGELNYKLGLRFEYTDQTLLIDNPDYFTLFDRDTKAESAYKKANWFPSLHMSYPLFERDNVTLAASRRISRAPLKNMAPFLYRRHLEVYVVGDPELKPEFINNLELTYSKGLGRQRLTVTGFHRAVDNAIFRVNTVYNEELVLIRSFTNSGNTTATGAELNANLDFGRNAKMFFGGSLYNYRVEADIFGYREQNKSLSWNLKGNATINLNSQLRLSADFDFISAEITAQGQNEMRYNTNASLAYSPKSLSEWSFTLRGLNLLNSNTRELSTRAYNSSGTQIFYQDTEFYWYGPIVELSINYNINWKSQRRSGESVFGRDEF